MGRRRELTLRLHRFHHWQGAGCTLVPSGFAAIAAVSLALLQPGDDVPLRDKAYDAAELTGERIRLVRLEAPGSVTLEFPGLRELVPLCHERGMNVA